MLEKTWASLDGYKIYGLALIMIATAFVGHFWGPIDQGAIQIPKYDWSQFWDIVQKAWLLIGGRSLANKFMGNKGSNPI